MAGLSATIRVRVVIVPCSEADFVDAVARVIGEHCDAAGREGIVPLNVAEDLVTRLRATGRLVTDEDRDGDDD